jgi:hypothetical protein
MSDGYYELLSQDGLFVKLTVSQGRLSGENDNYQYDGKFSVENSILQGVVTVKNKSTEKESRVPLSIPMRDDEDFKISIEIEGKTIGLQARKHRPERHHF